MACPIALIFHNLRVTQIQGKLINTQSRRVHDVRYQGEPIDLERKFLVAVNNYRAGGGV